jgi:SAM-dependent methyltransferase
VDHQDHCRLIEEGIPGPGGTWADFGSGTGAFTLALADLLGPTATIYSIDKDAQALSRQERQVTARFPGTTVHMYHHDYTNPVTLPPLDGIVMANALHFQKDKQSIVRRLRSYLRPDGHFILVEYNSDRGNPWVPHPLSYESWAILASSCGFITTRLLHTRPSRFMGTIYSALSINSRVGDG